MVHTVVSVPNHACLSVIIFFSLLYRARSSLCKPGLCYSNEGNIFEIVSEWSEGQAWVPPADQITSLPVPAGPISATRGQERSTFYYKSWDYCEGNLGGPANCEPLQPCMSFNM